MKKKEFISDYIENNIQMFKSFQIVRRTNKTRFRRDSIIEIRLEATMSYTTRHVIVQIVMIV
jgi:hypothetical protein